VARDFRKIIAWQKADDLTVEIYKATARYFPPVERFGLPSQICRAAVSVAANLAEGSGRQTLRDFVRFLHNSQGSLSEVEYYLHLAHRLKYLNQQTFDGPEAQRAEVGRLLNGFINLLKRKVAGGELI
jgi:four helix bundle protein